MRKVFLTAVMMVCVAGAGLASGQTDRPMAADQATSQATQKEKQKKKEKKDASRKQDCGSQEATKSEEQAPKHVDGDPEAPQNKVEYGGGG